MKNEFQWPLFNILLLLLCLGMSSAGWGQTTVSYDFSVPGAETGLNADPPIALDTNIGFASFKNSGTSNPGIFSGQLRLYQNATKGGSIKVYAQNGVTITSVVVYASGTTGPAEYTVDGGMAIPITISGGSYAMGSINSTSEIEFYCVGSSSSTRIYVDSFEVTYEIATSGPFLQTNTSTISDLDYTESNGPSASQSFELSGANLDGTDVDVALPALSDFEISADNTNFSDSLNFTAFDGTATTIYVRLKAGLAINTYTDDITISGGGATQNTTVTLNGDVTPAPPANDLCENAIALTVNGGIVSGTLEAATFSAPFNKPDVWYTITPAYNETYTITLTDFTGDADLFIYDQGSACPTTTTTIGSSTSANPFEEIVIALTSGITYYIRVMAFNAAAEDTFNIEVTAPAAPDPCVTPANQPTDLQIGAVTNAAISGSFTATTADGYLVVISESSTLSENPIDETAYVAGNTLGNGTIVQASAATAFTATGLDALTQYYIYVFAYNSECLDGPLYNITTPLTGTATTTDAPATPEAGTIFITEVSDAADFNNEYIEFYNNSDTPIDFTGAKLVMLNDGTVWNFGGSGAGNNIGTATIPARGFIIVTRGNDQTTFESEFGVLNTNTVFIQGTTGMFFGTGRDWQLWYGGASGTADGDLIDETTGGVADGDRDYQNIFTGAFVSDSDANANPGELDYLVYVDGGWVNDETIDDTTESLDVLLYDAFTATGNVEANDLYIAGAATFNLENVLTVNGDIANEGVIVFKSSSVENTAQFDTFTGNINGSGEVSIQRYIPARRAFRLLSSAVTTTTTINSNWQEGQNNTGANSNTNPGFGTHITGSTTGENGFDATPSGNPSLFTLNNAAQSWEAVTNTDVNTITAGNAYRLMVRGDRSINLTDNAATPTNTTLRTTGTLHTGPLTVNNLSAVANEFNFFGNPYPAAVDMNDVIAASTNINSNFYYIWDPTLSGANGRGAYVTIDLSVGDGTNTVGSAGNKFLQPGQAAFVLTLANGAASLQFEETQKNVVAPQTTVFDISSQMDVRLYRAAAYAAGETPSDGLRLKFGTDYTNAITSLDAPKFYNQDENLASSNDDLLWSIESRALPEEGESIPLFTNAYRTTDYVFEAILTEVNDINALLRDHYTGTDTLLENNDNTLYVFTIDPDDAASSATDRFEIVFEELLSTIDVAFGNGFVLFPNPAQGEITLATKGINSEEVLLKITNLLGQTVYAQTQTVKANGQLTLDASSLSQGVYVLKLTHNKGQFTTKFIKK